MSNKRFFMAGLGAGIMIGALMLQLIYAAQTDIVIGDQEKMYTEQEVAELLAARQPSEPSTSSARGSDGEAAGQAEDDAQEDPAAPANEPEEPASTTAPETTATPEMVATPSPTEIILRIYPGSSLTEAAALLSENRVFTNSAEEQAFIAKMKKDEKAVRAGTFKFSEGMTAGEAIKVVTGNPLPTK